MKSHKSARDQVDASLTPQLQDKIEEMVERVVLETILNLLERFLDTRKLLRPVCYRSDCKNRDEIPF